MPTTVHTNFGTFVAADNYKVANNALDKASSVGASIDITFTPADREGLADRPIGLIQSCRVTRPGLTLAEQLEDEPLLRARIQASANGWYIDQFSYALKGEKVSEEKAKTLTGPRLVELVPQTNPVYNSMNAEYGNLAKTLRDNTGDTVYGRAYHPTQGTAARLVDSPGRILLADVDPSFRQEFETAAITLNGDPRYLGSVRWGYTAQRNPNNTYTVAVIPFAVVGADRPSAQFFEAAAAWNDQKLNDYSIGEKIARVPVPIV